MPVRGRARDDALYFSGNVIPTLPVGQRLPQAQSNQSIDFRFASEANNVH
jgi:hypothetical protein